MPTILWILIFGLLMSMIALSGSLLLFFNKRLGDRMILPLVSFAAGSLIGGALFHMIPHAVQEMGNETKVYVWLAAGFVLFLGLEQFLNWHHSHTHSHNCSPLSARPHQHTCPPQQTKSHVHPISETHVGGLDDFEEACTVEPSGRSKNTAEDTTSPGTLSSSKVSQSDDKRDLEEADISSAEHPNSNDPAIINLPASSDCEQPRAVVQERRNLGYLILVADAVHNFLGGLFVGASFVDSIELGMSAWMAAAFHEVPQELGDFAILVHGGWSKSGALLCNFLSALTFPLGGLVAYASSRVSDVSFLIPFAAGNFIYIGATDLIPEVKHYHGRQTNLVHFLSFLLGMGILLVIRIINQGW